MAPFPGLTFVARSRAVKLHTMIDLRGSYPHLSSISASGKMADVRILTSFPSSRAPSMSWIVATSISFRLHRFQASGAFFVTRAKVGMDAWCLRSMSSDWEQGRDLRPTHAERPIRLAGLSRAPCAACAFRDPETGKTLSPDQQHDTASPDDLRPSTRSGGWSMFFKWIKQHLVIKRFLGTSENASQVLRFSAPCHLCPDRHRQEGAANRGLHVHFCSRSFCFRLREN